jgi:hypothetical protein
LIGFALYNRWLNRFLLLVEICYAGAIIPFDNEPSSAKTARSERGGRPELRPMSEAHAGEEPVLEQACSVKSHDESPPDSNPESAGKELTAV